MIEITTSLRKKIIDFLVSLPNIHDSESQRALIYHAGFDQELQYQIPVGRSPIEFISLLVSTLINYGKLKDGRYALEVMLEATKNYMGQEKKVYCDSLIEELCSTKQSQKSVKNRKMYLKNKKQEHHKSSNLLPIQTGDQTPQPLELSISTKSSSKIEKTTRKQVNHSNIEITFFNDLHEAAQRRQRKEELEDFIKPFKNLQPRELEKIAQKTGVNINAPDACERLSQILCLDLSDERLSDFSFLERLSGLQLLDLTSTNIDNVSSLRGLTKLQKLYLSYTPIIDLFPLKDLNQLKILRLEGTQIHDLHPLKGLNELQILNLSKTKVSEITPLKELVKLIKLDLSETQITYLEGLSDLSQLQILNLYSTNIQDILPLNHLNQLRVLYLENTPFYYETNENCDYVYKPSSLESLSQCLPNCQMYIDFKGFENRGYWGEYGDYYKIEKCDDNTIARIQKERLVILRSNELLLFHQRRKELLT